MEMVKPKMEPGRCGWTLTTEPRRPAGLDGGFLRELQEEAPRPPSTSKKVNDDAFISALCIQHGSIEINLRFYENGSFCLFAATSTQTVFIWPVSASEWDMLALSQRFSTFLTPRPLHTAPRVVGTPDFMVTN
uniref:Uncharacterized protein n=1 Tax=Myotis myotis TaxID=51298 RepID=A0A7J7RSL9_MYOMY|nr:hypothetical protein mMyoMyo1_010181 [Myotis myotis]